MPRPPTVGGEWSDDGTNDDRARRAVAHPLLTPTQHLRTIRLHGLGPGEWSDRDRLSPLRLEA